jgi:hypothetical protein
LVIEQEMKNKSSKIESSLTFDIIFSSFRKISEAQGS